MFAINNPGSDALGPYESALLTGDGNAYICTAPDGSKSKVPFTALKPGHAVVEASTVTFPAPVPESIPVPESVPKWAALHALIDDDLDTLPATYFAGLTGKEKKKAEAKWAADPWLRRDSPMLAKAIASGAVTAARVDALMIAADRIAAAAK